MSDNVEGIDTLDLDRRWNRIVREVPGAPIRISDRDIQDVILADDSTPPSSHFTATLRAQIREAAREMGKQPVGGHVHADTKLRTIPGNQREAIVPPSIAAGVSRWASLALVAAILLAVVGGTWYANRTGNSNQPTSIPAAAQASPESQGNGDGASSADLGNTRSLDGPAPVVPQSIAGALPIGINGMDVSEQAIVVEYGSVLTAYAPSTLAQLWSVELEYGVYSDPVIAGDQVFISFTAQRDGATEAMLGIDEMIDNQLLAFSLTDGSAAWSVDDAGAAPVAPLVVDGAVYSLGEAEGRWVVFASDAADGKQLWVSEPLSNQRTNGKSRPTVSPDISAALAYGSGFVAVNYADGVHVFASGSGELAWDFVGGEFQNGDYAASYGIPVIADGRLLISINRSGMPLDNTREPEDGYARVLAFDLIKGEELWRQEFATLWEVTSPSVNAGSVVFMAWLRDSETYDLADVQLKVADPVSGEIKTSISLGNDGSVGPFSGGITRLFDSAPVLIDDVAYLTTGSSNRGADTTAILTTVNLGDEAITSQTYFDGFSIITPDVSNGRLIFTTQVEGLLLVDGASTSTSADLVTTDLRTVNSCSAPVSELQIDLDALADATPVSDAPGINELLDPSDVPEIDPANAAPADVVEAIMTRFAEYQGCARLDEQERLYGFFSTGYYDMLVASGQTHILSGRYGEPRAPFFANSGEVQTLQVDTLQVLPDGRVSGIVTGQHSPRYVIWVLEDGDWKIDEWLSIVDPSDPASEATPD